MKKLFYTDQYVIPLPDGHRFPIQKYRLLRELLAGDPRFAFEPAPLADVETIELAHDPEYVRAFVRGELSPPQVRRIGFPWSEGLVRRTLASVGGTLAATREALANGWGGNLAGGTHHAFRGDGSGFCVFNDIAVAIRWAQKSGVGRAAVVDLDVHQGDGTAQIFNDDPQVLTASVHCEVNFPFRKQQSKLDVALPEGMGDDDYLAAIEPVLERVLEFRPEIVFYQAGVDVLASDALGKLKLSAEGVRRRDERVISAMRRAGMPLVITIGGGYSKPIDLTAQAHAATFRIAADSYGG